MNPGFFYTRRSGPRTRVPPPVDSEDSCLSDSEDSDDDWCFKPAAESSSSGEDPDGAPPKGSRLKVTWRTVKQKDSAKEVSDWGDVLPKAESIRLPIQYFRDFFDEVLLDSIVEQSNLYAAHRYPEFTLELDRSELEQFLGTVVYMSIFRLPESRMYWSSASLVQQVADVMSLDRWGEIKRFIHFSDNTAPKNDDKLFKIRLIIDSLLPKFQALPRDQVLCVGEQMVPFNGRSATRQYLKKPYKWGYKVFVLCNTEGLVHSFEVFAGQIDPGQPDLGDRGNVVLKLAQGIQGNVNHLLYFDRWFSSLDLFVALANKGIPALGTVQLKRLGGCGFSADEELKKKGRGSFEERQAVVENVEVRAVKWFDYRGVIAASTFASAQPVVNVLRRDRKLKKSVSVECPNIVMLYTKFGGGVEALDALMADYRVHIRSRKFYHRLFYHFVDVAVVNSWLLYRRDCDSLKVPRKKQKNLLTFRAAIAWALCMQGKDPTRRKRDRPSDIDSQFEKKKHRGPAKPIPAQEVRSDGVGHWPEVIAARKRCKLPTCKAMTTIKCTKCDVALCLNKRHNCYGEFHK